MRKTQILCISLAILATFASCLQDDGGYHVINTPSNGDPGSCILSLTVSVQSDALLFDAVQSAQDADHQDCTHQDLLLQGFFHNAPAVNGQVTLVADASNANHLTGTLTKAMFSQYDGTACANMGSFGGETWLTCRFKYGSIFFRVDWYAKADGSWDSDWTGLLYPSRFNNVNDGSIVRVNSTYQEYIGMLFENGQPYDNIINNVNGDIFITGSILQSQFIDMSPLLKVLNLYAIIVGDNSGNYRVWQTSPKYKPFANPSSPPNYATDIGVSYATVLQGLNCNNGCYMTLIFYDESNPQMTFALFTQGFSTASRLRA